MPLSFPSNPSVNQTSTQNGRVYRWSGAAWELAGGTAEDTALRALFLPPAPTNLAATVGNTQVPLTWTAPSATWIPPITDYVVQYSSNSGSTWTTFSDGTSTSTSATVTGLTNGTAYVFRVAGVNGVGTGAYTAASSAITPSDGDPLWSSVRLLFHADGANNSTTFTNTRGNGLALSVRGNAVVSTAQAKFGSGSLYIANTGNDGLNMDNVGSLLEFSGDYTIELWLWFSSIATDSTLYVTHDGRSAYHAFNADSTNYNLYFQNSSPVNIPHSLQANSWNHCALVRSGSTVSAYTNGVRVGTASSGGTHGFSSPSLARIASANASSYYIDDYRVTAAARYTGASFAVPAAAFPDNA